ncbi:MAG: ribonuclease P protein component [Ahrensia sp.]|nr:ribonuclease P protein component [Ahrensia sp.]
MSGVAETRSGLLVSTQLRRLKHRRDFLRARDGVKVHKPAFVLQMIGGPDPDIARTGLTVTKKIGNAVARNRAKRRLREALRVAELPLRSAGKDIVLIARPAALEISFPHLISDVEHAFAKALSDKTSARFRVAKDVGPGQNRRQATAQPSAE